MVSRTEESNHMCCMKETFININESYTGNIIFRDLSQMLVEGRGIILIKLKNGDKSSYQKFLCSKHEEQK